VALTRAGTWRAIGTGIYKEKKMGRFRKMMAKRKGVKKIERPEDVQRAQRVALRLAKKKGESK